MIYKRKIIPLLEKALKSPEIIVLTGMRRVGKTTVLHILFDKIKGSDKIFLDFENIFDRRIFEETNYDRITEGLKDLGIKKLKGSYVFIDEIQNFPGSVKAIKYLYDHYNIRFVLTGSSSYYLKNLFPESLAGRKVIYELFPLDVEEFLIFKKKEFRLAQSISS